MGYKQAIIDGKLVLTPNGKANGHSVRHDAGVLSARALPLQLPQRAKLSYDAARSGSAGVPHELDNHWAFADSLDADSANSKTVRQRLRDRSRYEQGSNGYYDGILNTHCNMLVGEGPTLRMLTGNRSFNQLVEREFHAWAQAVQLRRKLWAMCHARTGDGETFAVLVNNPMLSINQPVSTQVQLDFMPIEAEQCQTPFERLDAGRIDGIWFDQWNNVVAYDILPNHPGSGRSFINTDPVRVPASGVLHWFKLKRPGGHRGVPDMTSTLNVGATSRRSREATVAAQEVAANMAALIETSMGPATRDNDPDPMAPFTAVPTEKGTAVFLPMGWQAKQMKGEHPNAEYQAFHRLQITETARPLSMSYNVAAADSSTHSFASGKLDMLGYRLALNVERLDCNDLVLDPLFSQWFREWTIIADRRDIIPNHQWDWPAHAIIDAVAESNARDTNLKNGTLTLRQAYSDIGQDFEDQLTIMAEDTFGDASDENIAKMRQIVTLKNTPQHCIPQVTQLLGIKMPTAEPPRPRLQVTDDEAA